MQIEERIEQGITLWTITATVGDRRYEVRQDLCGSLTDNGAPLWLGVVRTWIRDIEQPFRVWPTIERFGETLHAPFAGPITIEYAIRCLAWFVDLDIEEDRVSAAYAA